MQFIDYIDSHTAGEPTRVVVGGFADLGSGTLSERRSLMQAKHDDWRNGIVCEPRGHAALVGALLLPPRDPQACIGTIFFNNAGYLGMCGHGTMGVVRTLQHLGRIGPGAHFVETLAGTVGAHLHVDGRVSIDNVESYRHAADVHVDVPGYGTVRGDVAWGGNWFFLTEDVPVPLELRCEKSLSIYAAAVRRALNAAVITGAGGSEIDHIELGGPSATVGVDGRNFVLCPGLAYDRSPCGTGTSAKLACLAASGRLGESQPWRQESILGSVFEGHYRRAQRGIWPTITGSAHILGAGRLWFDESDPFRWGSGA